MKLTKFIVSLAFCTALCSVLFTGCATAENTEVARAADSNGPIYEISWINVAKNTYVNSITEEVLVTVEENTYHAYDYLTAGSNIHYHGHVVYYNLDRSTFYYYDDNDNVVTLTNAELKAKPNFT